MKVRLTRRIPRVATVFALVAGLLQMASPASASAWVDDIPLRTWDINGTVYATIQVGGVVYEGGQFTSITSPDGATTVTRKYLAAFDAATGDYLPDAVAQPSYTVRALASDGISLYVGGGFDYFGTTTADKVSKSRLAKLSLATGAVDPGFTADTDAMVYAIQLVGTSLYAGGAFQLVNGVSEKRAVKVDATTGAIDTGFSAQGDATVFALKKSPTTDSIYLGGNFTTINGVSRVGLAEVSATTGAVAPRVFATVSRPVFGVDVSSTGDKVFGALGGTANAVMGWDAASGSRLWRQVTDGDIQAVAYFHGKVYFGFHDGYLGNPKKKLLLADASSGLIDPDFQPNFDDFWGVYCVVPSALGLLVGGDFTSVNTVPVHGEAWFAANGIVPKDPIPAVHYLSAATSWKYWDLGPGVPTTWAQTSFNASTWKSGFAQLGYGDGDETTVIGYGPSATSKYITSYFRSTFTVDTLPDNLSLQMIIDDGAVAYVNGVEVARDNMPTGTISYSTRASTGRAGQDENTLRTFTIPASALVVGTNSLAVEVHQDSAGSSDLSYDAELIGTWNLDQVPPSTPTDLVASNLTSSGVTLTWQPSTDNDAVTGYFVLRNGVRVATVSTPTYTDSALAASTTYSYTVKAFDPTGNLSAASAPLSVTTPAPPDSVPPSAPTDLAMTSVSDTTVGLSWTAATDNIGVDHYNIYRGTGRVVARVYNGDTTYLDTGLTPSSDYTYTVKAVDAAGNTSAASAPLDVTTAAQNDTDAPTVPTGLTATSEGTTGAALAWVPSSDNVGVVGYRVYRDGTSIATTTSTSYADTGLTPGSALSYTVSAFDLAGNDSGASAAAALTLPLYVGSFTGADGSAWPTAWTTGTGLGAGLTLQGGAGRISTPVANSWGRAKLTESAPRADSDLLLSYAFSTNTSGRYFDVYLRGSTDWQNAYRPTNGYGLEISSASATVSLRKNVAGVPTTLLSVKAQTITTAKQWLRLRVVGSTVSFRIWPDGTAEPTTWQGTVTDTSVTAPGQLFMTYVSGSTVTAASTLDVDDVLLTTGQ